MIPRKMYITRCGVAKKHKNNIMFILNFVIFLSIISEVTTVEWSRVALDVRIVLICGYTPADTDVFKTSSGRLKKVATSYD